MSLITQCPACSTMFRVVPDQLRISEGWVRCGHCDEVFDANAHLRRLEEAATTVVPAPVSAAEPDPSPQPLDESSSDAYPATSLMPMQALTEPAYDWGPGLSEPEPAPEAARPTFSLQAASLLDEQSAHDTPTPFAEGLAASQGFSDSTDGWEPTQLASVAPLGSDSDGDAPLRLNALVEDPPPSFMGSGRHQASTHRWLGKKTLLGGCILMLLLLVLQVLLQERDRIAAVSPSLRPLLAAGCEVLACTVSAPREIESIAIDSSAFTSVRSGVYLLRVNLKNVADIALATPALELTLTDTQDRPLLRRVVLPGELGGQQSVAAGAELGASLPISIKSGVTPEKIAGYKLLAFYP